MAEGLPRLAVVGIHGYGASHLRAATERLDKIDLVGVCDTKPDDSGRLDPRVPVFTDVAELLDRTRPEIVTIATPIHTHLPFAEAALRSGADVLLEKPPVATLDQFDRLLAVAAETGRVVQIGFQSLGSAAFPALDTMIDSGRLGELVGISGVGVWLRTFSYWRRSAWAGRRVIDGVPVMDGVITNPLAHATSAALRLARAQRADDLAEVEVDLFRANAIESDDTSVVRVVTNDGTRVTLGLTLCAEQSQEAPYVEVVGTEQAARFFYTQDLVELRPAADLTGAPAETLTYERTSLLDNLLAHRATGEPLLCPLIDTGGFMRVVDAVAAGEPRPLAPSATERVEADGEQRMMIPGIDGWVRRAAYEHATFTALGAPFAR
ncbi:Gfo/Idh/MocA family protein [Microlunatus parietis]|uniref:Putative dehydrogenase n=1 Tax=Microlunatus parietis TaxID=682979 RepID=A0A7Y9I8Z9_9ACTN|nr:Gfo/Idh/MocA family oxidoreductase [Microlunatus parietis]NYE72218.1 putative dehydrogenase [Microlunatus parietis]